MGTKFILMYIRNIVLKKIWRSDYWSRNECTHRRNVKLITLLKCIICNLPKYLMSLLATAANVAIHIEKLQRDFLLMGLGEEFELGKEVFAFVIVVDWMLGRLWYLMMPFWSWLMNKICLCIKSANGGRQNFLNLINLKWVIVLELSFGLDVWYCDAPLEESLPKLCRIARDKEAFIVNHMQFKNGLVYWELNVIRVTHFFLFYKLFEQYMIGNWNLFRFSQISYIQLTYKVLEWISYAWGHLFKSILRLDVITKF